MDRRLLVIILIGAGVGCLLCALMIVTGIVASTHAAAFIVGGWLSVTGALFVERA